MTTADSPPYLRLVGTEEVWEDRPTPAPRDDAPAVARENRAAADNHSLDPLDPRWVLAVRAYSQLQGATLTFDRRQRLMRTAHQLGVRPFDANIIIAIVQDHARRGEQLGAATGTLALVKSPAPPRPARWTWTRWIAATASAAAGTAFLAWWLVGA